MKEKALHIGAAVRHRRDTLRISQRALSAAAQISPTTLNRFEMGETTPHPSTEIAIAVALGWPRNAIQLLRDGANPADLETSAPPEMVTVPKSELEEILAEVRELRAIHEDTRRRLEALPTRDGSTQ